LLLAAAVAVYPAELGSRAWIVSALVGGPAVLLVLAALLGRWDDGLVAGSVLLLAGYAVSLAVVHHSVDPVAPAVGAALVALVDLGSWSLELRDGRESLPFHHLRTLLALVLGSLAVSAVVVAVGDLGGGGGIVLWIVGAGSAAAVLLLLRGSSSPAASAR
jgi:hypothetical protein